MDVEFHISTDEQNISPVCDFTYSWCLNCGLPENDAVRFTLAVSELISDIILFAFPNTSNAYFDLHYRHSLSNVELVVSEVGEPFDPDRHRYNARKAVEKNNFEGAGLRLIRRFCDEFLFINKGREGKEFRLSKSIKGQEIDEMLRLFLTNDEEELTSQDVTGDKAAGEEFSFDQIGPSDAEDISKLIYRTYEYTYAKEDLYFPKKIEDAVLEKEKLGVIARNSDREAIGYFAVLKKGDSNIAEVGEAVVSPEYRRRGVMSKMMKHLIDAAREQKLLALFGKAITVHPASQRVNQKYGFTSTALLLAEADNIVLKGFEEQCSQPISEVIEFLPLSEQKPKTVYFPEKYTDILEETYGELGITIDHKTPARFKLAKRSDIELIINYSESTSLIVVHKYGPDFEAELKDMIGSLEQHEKNNAVYLDLPLENSATPSHFTIIENLGFTYCGLVYLFHHERDYLRLQKISVALDLDLVEVYSEFGNKIKSLVADEYYKNT